MDFKISGDLAQAILDYLTTRPYREVFALVAELRGIAPVEPATEGAAAAEPAK